MNSYYSLTYLWLFLPLVMLFYQMTPQKHRWKVLLGSSYLFYWILSQKLIVYLLMTTVVVHYAGLWMTLLQNEKKQALTDAEKEAKKAIKARYQKKLRAVMLLAVLFNLGVLLVIKYSGFFGENVNTVLRALHLPFRLHIPRFLQPLGISFYTMQAVAYLIDVYRGTISADRNLGRLALFLGFFPQIMEGPICRYCDTAEQLWKGERISYRNARRGAQRIVFGVLKKMLIADYQVPVLTSASWWVDKSGLTFALAMLSYTLQLYMEFSGTLDMVIGTAEIFGVRMPENFCQPFFSRTVSEFWKRWHITLGTWFRDYVFYPVSVSKTLKHRLSGFKARFGARAAAVLSGAVALFCVWICNGLWHGAAWKYIFFGLYHFVLILTGVLMEPLVLKLAEKWKINRESWPYRVFQMIRTTFLVCIGELIFWAEDLKTGLYMLLKMFTDFHISQLSWEFLAHYGLEPGKLLMMGGVLLVLFAVSVLREKKIDVRDVIEHQNVVVRWSIYYAVLIAIILFGAYGPGYIPVDPIYANF